MMPAMSSPSRRLKPIRMKTTVPIQKSIRFFIRILPAFFALVKPVSTIANPACIQNTSAAPIRNQTPNTSPFKTLKISSVIIVPPRFPGGEMPTHACVGCSLQEQRNISSSYCGIKKRRQGFLPFEAPLHRFRWISDNPVCPRSGICLSDRMRNRVGLSDKKGAATFCRSTFAMLAV